MNKRDVIQLALVILGIVIIVEALLTIVEQIGLLVAFSDEISNDTGWFIVLVMSLAAALIIGWYLIKRSGSLALKLSKGTEQKEDVIKWDKKEVIHVAVIVICLFFLVKLFTSFISSLYSVFQGFFDRYSGDHYPEHLWVLILYASLFYCLRHSRKFTAWLLEKVLSENKSAEQKQE